MRKTHWALAATLLGAVALAWAGAGRAEQGVGEKVGETLDDAGRVIKRGLQRSGETVREGFARTKVAVNNMGVETRIYGRLHWDKDLNGSLIELEVRNGGVAILRGAVPTAAAKAKAVMLTRDTVGVLQVVDQLSVSPPSRVIEGSPKGAAGAPRPADAAPPLEAAPNR